MPPGWQGRGGPRRLQGEVIIYLEGRGDKATAYAKAQMPDDLGMGSSLPAQLPSH